MEHCVPFQRPPILDIRNIHQHTISNNGKDQHTDDAALLEEVRDAAMACMRVLLQIPCDQYTATTTTHDGNRTLRDDCIQFRLSVAQDSVQNRCASLDDLDDDDDDII